MEVQGLTAGHSYTLRLYHNQSHGTSGLEHTVTVVSMNLFPDLRYPGQTLATVLALGPGKLCLCYRQGAGRGSPGLGDPAGGAICHGATLCLVAGGRAAP